MGILTIQDLGPIPQGKTKEREIYLRACEYIHRIYKLRIPITTEELKSIKPSVSQEVYKTILKTNQYLRKLLKKHSQVKSKKSSSTKMISEGDEVCGGTTNINGNLTPEQYRDMREFGRDISGDIRPYVQRKAKNCGDDDPYFVVS